MSALDDILANKRRELALAMRRVPPEMMKSEPRRAMNEA